MTDIRHPEQREGSPNQSLVSLPGIPHVVRDDSHLNFKRLYHPEGFNLLN